MDGFHMPQRWVVLLLYQSKKMRKYQADILFLNDFIKMQSNLFQRICENAFGFAIQSTEDSLSCPACGMEVMGSNENVVQSRTILVPMSYLQRGLDHSCRPPCYRKGTVAQLQMNTSGSHFCCVGHSKGTAHILTCFGTSQESVGPQMFASGRSPDLLCLTRLKFGFTQKQSQSKGLRWKKFT